MDPFDISLDTNLERVYFTLPIMRTLSEPPYNYQWDGPSPGSYEGQRDAVEDQIVALAGARAATSFAAALWDQDLDALIKDASIGTRLARVRHANDRAKLQQFDALSYRPAGRDGRYQQALDFESVWKAVEPGWTFKPDPNGAALTLAQFTARRDAIVTVRQVNHSDLVRNEGHERSELHVMADDLNEVSVRWYEAATTQYPVGTVAGNLICTIPTTYDPNRVPGQLKFTTVLSPSANTMQLVYRAPRGEKYYIRAKGPGQQEFITIINGSTQTEWLGLGLTAGVWEIEGWATNEHGQGATSELVQVTVAAAMAA